MSDDAYFQEFYLREIGVQTPLSLLSETDGRQGEISSPAPAGLSLAMASVDELTTVTTKTSGDAGSLDDLACQASSCTRCSLAENRNKVVFGVGSPHAEIVFIGEAPGRNEDLKGEPFVGRAGQLLDRMLASLGLSRSDVYIMNTVKCRPPNNRDPKPEEVEACGKWFDAQLAALSPKVICLLGRVAAQTVLETDAPLSALRGKWHRFHGIPVRVMYHPAYLLRSPQQKRHAWNDLCTIRGGDYSGLS